MYLSFLPTFVLSLVRRACALSNQQRAPTTRPLQPPHRRRSTSRKELEYPPTLRALYTNAANLVAIDRYGLSVCAVASGSRKPHHCIRSRGNSKKIRVSKWVTSPSKWRQGALLWVPMAHWGCAVVVVCWSSRLKRYLIFQFFWPAMCRKRAQGPKSPVWQL